ncbi:MAG: peptide chain release factor 2 [Patescibacteria group bacterium]|nr:peptide chain release factor 2 [Patescibacteria group bacterium]MDD5121067.1 peptide chain release factor 2 [Patescibacteria group bacterium]MDD5221571.1 peptide chain release factor 2 [Patescibacteria group bacterium]MDD5396014.1 peptide chain release factor 2 [Patescibacteria group bacterium]
MENVYQFLNGEYDKNSVVISFHAGVGGTDAQDWTEMLRRMYWRYAEKKKWKVYLLDESWGSEAGLKSSTLEIVGSYAYGHLKKEAGVHRLVRISPFDAEKMRHTSFALVDVLPEIPNLKIDIKDKDLKIEFYRASGHGGQNVQKVESAVRLTHLPTKITVNCQVERSQAQNKERAMKILASKLYQFHQAKREEEKELLRGRVLPASWGHQARSYVLHPYKMIKDHRSNWETSDVDRILDGNLDDFVLAELKPKQ